MEVGLHTALAFLEDREGLKAAKAEKDYHEIKRLHAAVKKVMEKARREEVEHKATSMKQELNLSPNASF